MKIKKKDEIDIYTFNFYQGCQTGIIVATYRDKSFLYNFGIPIAISNTDQWNIFNGWHSQGFNLIAPKKEYYNILNARIKNDLNCDALEKLNNLILLINLLYDLSENEIVYTDNNECYSNNPKGKVLFRPFDCRIVVRSSKSNYTDLQSCQNTTKLRSSAYNILKSSNALSIYLTIIKSKL